jgi:starvation-inducible DNA-binding protein
MTTSIGIQDSNREAVCKILNRALSDTVVLNFKTRNYHWNVAGIAFSQLHKFFEEQYTLLDASMDEIAERVRALGGRTFGTLAEFSKTATLSEKPGAVPAAKAMVADLLADHEAVIKNLRKDIPVVNDKFADVGTADFLTSLLEGHEKMAWMLRAHLE